MNISLLSESTAHIEEQKVSGIVVGTGFVEIKLEIFRRGF